MMHQHLQQRAPALLCGLFVLLMLPFLDKAVHLDDPLFLWSAERILQNPLDFYGVQVNWYGWDMPLAEVMKNPPLTSYYLALLMAIGGASEVVLHLGMLAPGVLCVLGMYHLGALFCRRAWLAALLAVLTPPFLIAAGGFMAEALLLPLWVWAVYCHVKGERDNDTRLLLLGAVLAGLAVLAKYNALALPPLLLAYSLARHRAFRPRMALLLIPVGLALGYHWGTALLYGQGLLTDAMHYSLRTRGAGLQLLQGLAFLGGCLPGCLLLLPLAWRRGSSLLFLLLGVAVASAFLLAGSFGGVPLAGMGGLGLALQAAVFVTAGIHVLLLAVRDMLRQRDAEALLLLLWVWGQFAFAVLLNWTISARTFLPLAPAACILVVRALESMEALRTEQGAGGSDSRLQRVLLLPTLLLAGALSFSVAWCDYLWANSGRSAAIELGQERANIPENVWFAGHWGFQYHMQRLGFRPLDHTSSMIRDGDLLVLPLKLLQRPIPLQFFEKRAELTVPGCAFLSVHHERQLAGFHSSVFGPLPYVFAACEPHRFELHIALRDLRLVSPKPGSQ